MSHFKARKILFYRETEFFLCHMAFRFLSLNLCLLNGYLIDNLLQIVVAIRVKSYVHICGQVVILTSLCRNHSALSKYSAVRKPGPDMKVSPTNTVFSYKYLKF